MPKKFYILPQYIKNNKIYLPFRDAHHISNVLRYKVNQRILFFDAKGNEYLSAITNISAKGLTAEIIEVKPFPAKQNIEVTLAQALVKSDKFEMVIQKATELGVNKIIPVCAQRSLVNLDYRQAAKKKERWERIIKEAAQQCGRGNLARIELPQSLKAVLDSAKDYDLVLFFCLDGEARPLKEILRLSRPKKILVFIGPEGDFSLEEISAAKEKNIPPASLGNSVLRVETAAITVLSILNYEYN